ncbi:MAG: prepilin-type N-terminal cleavage/methylation domain-containing protein [Candidatus Roizmanbacteria bacterium]|nr:prepilin-type N-terminal cleavage/methylation domain-containing protein [Candidatus Roizmanbacteria bacterium]
MSRSGFSLTELLISVAILAVIAGIGATTYIDQLSRGRDQTRMADIARIQSALEKFRADHGEYPAEQAWCETSIGSCGHNCPCTGGEVTGNWHPNSLGAKLVPNYLVEIPVDPINDTGFYYYYEPVADDGNEYTACGRTLRCETVGAGLCAYALSARLEDGTVYEVCNQ